jgi:hypothetical protein
MEIETILFTQGWEPPKPSWQNANAYSKEMPQSHPLLQTGQQAEAI